MCVKKHAMNSLICYHVFLVENVSLLLRTKVLKVVEGILVRYTTTNGLVNTNKNNGNAMILAASDNTISLDGLFSLIRRPTEYNVEYVASP